MENAGFSVEVSPEALSSHGLFSASDETRLRELEEFFRREDIDAVFCSRGGVGASRLLASLNTKLIAASGKPFLHFSDGTALGLLLWKQEKYVTFSGPLAVEWSGGVSADSCAQAISILTGRSPCDLVTDAIPAKLECIRYFPESVIHAPLIAGNLTMITSLLGTPYMPDLSGAMLLIEDINEPPHRVDRLLFHLKNAGQLSSLAALLIGDFWSEPTEMEISNLKKSLLDACDGTEFPIVLGFPYGHGQKRMTVPIGMTCELDLDKSSLRSACMNRTPVA